MKKNVHPKTNDLKISCACGASFEVSSTREQFSVDICSNCHPFFTGQQKFVDRAGRIEKFQRRFDVKK
ncbi:MAG: 50S ribosomal protein L31 [Candidatus Dependentiae bacterium]|jgi:large subunit ribosomal protein L31